MNTYAVALYVHLGDNPLHIHVLTAESELDALKEGVVYMLNVLGESVPPCESQDFIYTLDSVDEVKSYLLDADMVCEIVRVG